jgi:CRISPR-associated protein Cas1
LKKLLNTLFVTTQKAYLFKEGASVVVKVEGKNRLRLPLHTLDGIVCFGAVSMSPFLMGFCAESGVTVSFLSRHGRFLARVHGPVTGNVRLRREQYRRAESGVDSRAIALFILQGKLYNSRSVLRRFIRDHPDNVEKVTAVERGQVRLSDQLRRLDSQPTLEALRGLEGEAAANYFSLFDHLITGKSTDFFFAGRSRRPPLDRVNAMLSFVYTLLVHDCRSALEGVGLDPYIGFLHADRPGRPGLALDLMEEFRSWLADRLVLSLINRQQIQSADFRESQSGAVLLDETGRKTVLSAWQKRKQDEIVHPFLGERVSIGLLFHIQARLFSRYLRGELDGYPPFLWK